MERSILHHEATKKEEKCNILVSGHMALSQIPQVEFPPGAECYTLGLDPSLTCLGILGAYRNTCYDAFAL